MKCLFLQHGKSKILFLIFAKLLTGILAKKNMKCNFFLNIFVKRTKNKKILRSTSHNL